jgi:hypothetical protein
VETSPKRRGRWRHDGSSIRSSRRARSASCPCVGPPRPPLATHSGSPTTRATPASARRKRTSTAARGYRRTSYCATRTPPRTSCVPCRCATTSSHSPARQHRPRARETTGDTGRATRTHPTRGRGPRTRGRRSHQPVDRRAALHQFEDRQRSRVQHPAQARGHQPRRSRRASTPARPHLSARLKHRSHQTNTRTGAGRRNPSDFAARRSGHEGAVVRSRSRHDVPSSTASAP